MKRSSIFLAILMMSCLCVGCGGKQSFKGLVLKAPSDVKVSLYSGFANGTLITPDKVVEGEAENYYYFSGLSGAYQCRVAGSGYYTVTKSIVMTDEKNQTETLMDVTPGKMANAGWETPDLRCFTDELLGGVLSDDLSQWPEYAQILTSPYFTQDHADHQMTTQAQLEAFLKELDGADDRMYLYSAGTSGIYRHNIPMAIFTQADLSGAATLEQAAQVMGKDKPTVLIRAQMHGYEPAGGEAALAMCKWLDGALGDQLLDKLNVCVIPRQNPDGAQTYTRQMMAGIDPNRDLQRLQTQEMTDFVQICRWLEPEIIIDAHEYGVKNEETTLPAGDVLVQTGITVDNTASFRELNLELTRQIFDAAAKNGLTYRYYHDCATGAVTSISGGYATKQGSLYILLETQGLGGGLTSYSRRIMSHITSMEAVLRYAAENADTVQSTVAAERQTIIEKGAKYDPDNIVPLKVVTAEDASLQHPAWVIDQVAGTITKGVQIPVTYSVIARSRVAPTAYVIPAGESFTENVLALMDKHGIAYTFIPEGSTVQLQQYSENEEDLLTEETAVTFPQGAYVFCKNQVGGLLLSMLMEPDVDDVAGYSGTLVQQGMITADKGVFPIYRYIHDLNDEGMINYR